MKRTILLGALAAALLTPFAATHAHSNVSVSVSTPEFGIRIGGPVYRPAPVYVPAPVYAPVPVYAPAPVYGPVPYYAAPPVHVTPRVVYPAPRVIYRAPVIVAPPRYYGPGVWVAPRPHGHRYRDGWHDGRREHRRERDSDHYRAGYGY